MYNMPSDYYFPFLSKSSSYIHVFINFYIIDVLYVWAHAFPNVCESQTTI